LGLSPKAFTLDGHQHVIKALIATWSSVIIQRCLFHIQNQGLMWIRKPPRTQAGKDLSFILKSCTSLKTKQDCKQFVERFYVWNKRYNRDIELLDKSTVAYKDLKRTRSLIANALKDMFHFVKDQNIAKTTNYLENFFKQLKQKYRGHNGLSLNHKIAYLKWYCFFKN
jgi:transposase-like protein